MSRSLEELGEVLLWASVGACSHCSGELVHPPNRRYLCAYHEGYSDALDALASMVAAAPRLPIGDAIRETLRVEEIV